MVNHRARPPILPSYARWPWVVAHQDGTNDYSATRLKYARNGQTVSYMINETWTWDGDPANCPTAYDVAFAREFRYDGGRQRYLNRELDVAALMKGDIVAVPGGETWTDYDGDEPYGDYQVTPANPPYPPIVTDERSFELGLGTVDPWTASDGITTSYYHTDLIGTTRHMTDGSGNPASSATYTAFGERIDGSNQRYGYAGVWGYQSHDEFPFLHVGARYYDPATGRFLQRDPIGIRGGLNVYEYASSSPSNSVDPLGLTVIDDIDGVIDDITNGRGPGSVGGVGVGAAAGAAADWSLRQLFGGIGVGCAGWWAGWNFGKWYYPRAIKPHFDYYEKRRYDRLNAPPRRKGSSQDDPFWFCFVSGTRVLTVAGARRIEELSVGTTVVSRCSKSSAVSESDITAIFSGWTDELVQIQLPHEMLTCTAEHPFWVVGFGWRRASELNMEDGLLNADGQEVPVLSVFRECRSHPVRVYNIVVADEHVYFVGNSRILAVQRKVALQA